MEASTEDEERVETQILRRLDRIEGLLEQERDVARRGSPGDDEPPGR